MSSSHLPRPTATRALDSCIKDPCSPQPLCDIGLGCIAWLPVGYKPPPGSTLLHPEEGASDHPIVVLSIAGTDPEVAIITFALLRSFRSTNGADTSKPKFWDHYVEVWRYIPWNKNTRGLPGKLMLEYREHQQHLRRESYIDVRKVYSARWRDLRIFDRSQDPSGSFLRLNKQSFASLRERMKGCKGLDKVWKWVRTDQLKKDYATRVKRLEIYNFVILLLCLLPTIVAKVGGIFPRLGRGAGSAAVIPLGGETTISTISMWLGGILGVLLPQALTRTHVGAATPEGGSTREGMIHGAARMLTFAIQLLLHLFVLPSHGGRRRSSSDLVSAGITGLSLCVALFEALATQRPETRVPAKATSFKMDDEHHHTPQPS